MENHHNLNLQEVFDKVATHLLTQNKKSMALQGFTCVYRSKDGCKCAVGVLIDDAYYGFYELENRVVDHPAVKRAVCKSLGIETLTIHDTNFLISLQNIHDGKEVEDWKDNLSQLAKEYGLSTEKLGEETRSLSETL